MVLLYTCGQGKLAYIRIPQDFNVHCLPTNAIKISDSESYVTFRNIL